MAQPVSIVVPVYNAADTIAACIDSLCAQTYTELDIVLVDDGSQDESGHICDEKAEQDSRIHVIHQKNLGRTAARWKGTQEAVGEWLTYVDADDQLMADGIERLLMHASEDTDIVLGNSASIGHPTGVIPLNQFRHLAVRGEGTIGVPWGSLYRRSQLMAYLFDLPRDIVNGEDYIFWLRLIFQTTKDVRTLYESVYMKGDEHTSNVFQWTSDYCDHLNQFRMNSIPQDMLENYRGDTLIDRIANLFAATLDEPRNVWQKHVFYREIQRDMERLDMHFSPRQQLFLKLPSRRLRRLYSWLSDCHSLGAQPMYFLKAR